MEELPTDEDSYRKRILNGFKGKPKRFYGHMRKLQTVKDNVRALRKDDGHLTKNDEEAANTLAEHFQSIFTKEKDGILPRGTDIRKPADIKVDFSEESVLKKLQGLAEDKSPGPDGIHPLFLKSCAMSLARPLAHIFQKSYDSSQIPSDWRTAHIMPIYKKAGARSDPANYRPVSLTSVVCKLMESIIKDALTHYLEVNAIISPHQHGFMTGRSCLTNLLETLECWTKALDEGLGIDVLYLDYRKAFDSVPHKRLIERINEYGITGKLLEWVRSFLYSRKTKVGIRGSFSDWFEVLSGVPQGSVLGPLLFLLFVNELPLWIVNNMRMFADDTKLWACIHSEADSQSLQDDLNKLVDWSNEWQLGFNPTKCKLMHIGQPLQNGVASKYYMMDGTSKVEVQSVNEEKDLGVYFASDLKSSKQCIKSAAKARSVLGLVRRHFRRLDIEDFLIIYKTYVRPHLEICIQAWSPHLQKDIQRLESVQRAATKLVPSLRNLSYENRLQALQLTSLYDRRIRGDLIETFKILSGFERISSNQFFQLQSSGYATRGHTMKLQVQRARLDVRKHFFSQRVVQHWNSLPQRVVDATSVTSFKRRLDNSSRYGH